MDFGHSLKYPYLRLFFHFGVIFCVCLISFGVIAYQNPVIGSSYQPYNDFLVNGVTCGFWLPPADHISLNGKTGIHSETMWYDREYVTHHFGEIGLLWLWFLLLLPPVGYVRYQKYTAILYWVRVLTIEFWIPLPPVLWCFMQGIQIESGGSQYSCCPITLFRHCFSYIVRR
jgi:hypothetical protein